MEIIELEKVGLRLISGGSSSGPQEDYTTTSKFCQELNLTAEEEELLDEEFDRIYGDEYEEIFLEDIFSD